MEPKFKRITGHWERYASETIPIERSAFRFILVMLGAWCILAIPVFLYVFGTGVGLYITLCAEGLFLLQFLFFRWFSRRELGRLYQLNKVQMKRFVSTMEETVDGIETVIKEQGWSPSVEGRDGLVPRTGPPASARDPAGATSSGREVKVTFRVDEPSMEIEVSKNPITKYNPFDYIVVGIGPESDENRSAIQIVKDGLDDRLRPFLLDPDVLGPV